MLLAKFDQKLLDESRIARHSLVSGKVHGIKQTGHISVLLVLNVNPELPCCLLPECFWTITWKHFLEVRRHREVIILLQTEIPFAIPKHRLTLWRH
jgi:hypothetical protein